MLGNCGRLKGLVDKVGTINVISLHYQLNLLVATLQFALLGKYGKNFVTVNVSYSVNCIEALGKPTGCEICKKTFQTNLPIHKTVKDFTITVVGK